MKTQRSKDWMARWFGGAVLIALVMGSGSRALADDLQPPPWRDLSKPFPQLVEWTFPTPANPALADFIARPDCTGSHPLATLGPAEAHMFNMMYVGGGWATPFGPGQVHLYLNNWVDTEPRKDIRVQITFQGDPLMPPSILEISGFDSHSGSNVLGSFVDSGFMTIDPLNGIHHLYEDWVMYPNPDWETIVIDVPGDLVLHQIVVDTNSTIPEPSSLVLLALGGLVMLRWRRGVRAM